MKNLLTQKCISSPWLNFHKKKKKIKWRMERKVDSRSFRDGAVKKFYSPKILSDKKSSAFPGIRSAIPRSGHPGHHARTQRGRLKELRNRCVARKFLYLWIRKTFGRVFPSKARCYYKQRVLRKVFEEWKGEWWVSQREWKLCVRADCYYRYYLYSLMFQTWRTYVHQQQSMRNKYTRAENYDAKQKMRRAWKSWLIYVVFRRTKFQMQTTALEFRQRSILWAWWSEWRRQLGQVRVGRALCASAVTHRALSLKLQAWSRWQEQLLLVQRERQKLVCAVKHRQHWQKCRCLKAWLDYLQARRVKGQQNEMAERFHHVTVLQTHFCDWQWAWQRRQSWHACHARVQALAGRVVLRRAFTHWKHYVLLCAEDTARWKGAEEHCRRRLLHFCFRALRGNVTRARLQRMRRNLAHQQHDVGLLCRFWNLWQSRIQQREEREQRPLLQAAWDHHRRTLLRRCVRWWLQRMQKRRDKELLQARADRHFQQRTLPAAFQAWRRLWRWRLQESVLEARAARFHRETLEKQVFAIWWQKMFRHQEHRLAERMAILHAQRQLLCRCWSTWHRRAAAHRQERQWQAVARAHHRQARLRTAFSTWKESARGLRSEKTGGVLAAAFLSARLLRGAWHRWRQCLTLWGAEQQKLMRADLHHQHTLLHRALHTWGAYQSRVRSVLQEVAARESQHQRQLLRSVLRRWRENAAACVEEARKTSRARAHYRRGLCLKVLTRWREAAAVQIYRRQRADCALREAQRVLAKGCLRTWFRRWRARGRRVAQQRAQLERAARHYRQQLLLQGLACWKVHHLGCVRKRLLQRRGTQLRAQTLSRSCFRQWQHQLENRRQEQRDTARALWLWAFSLQAKVWAAWLGFVLERRRKKARLERAVQAYHQQLLQEGATCLLRFTADMKALRQQLHAQQQVQVAHSLHRAVHRCAMLWKQKVLGPGRAPPPTSTVPSRRVTFRGPLPDHGSAAAGDAAPETRRPRAPRGTQGALGSLALDAGDPPLLELSAVRSARKQPRRPNFLLEPLQSQRPLGGGSLGGRGPETPREPDLGLAPPTGSSLTRPFSEKAQTVLVPGSALPSASGLKLVPMASTGPQLLPPSSFMPCGVGTRTEASAWVTSPGLMPQAPLSLASVPDPCLLLPEAVTGGPSSETAGVHLRSVSAWVPSIQPGPSWERGQDQVHCPVALGHSDLEAELESIQRQLQDYQSMKQSLRSYQRQASSLRRWLELSREEPRPEDQEAEQQVQEELQEVELQAQQLAAELQARRQPVSACIARVQALRRALC
ncbi:LOW QUALITY PROTEIN: protein SFI1 homolog [Myotis daubentonii]|uniref:LOW QUALITY PROTEIN: protein SFI1 homolog n=1 Tax=Myotis daubentonii TaxID=98922 RepID=UPI002873027B|nr:LOW QUALITY PROTEIN: protein SFI1 homolog [Myotis daubentonii]